MKAAYDLKLIFVNCVLRKCSLKLLLKLTYKFIKLTLLFNQKKCLSFNASRFDDLKVKCVWSLNLYFKRTFKFNPLSDYSKKYKNEYKTTLSNLEILIRVYKFSSLRTRNRLAGDFSASIGF